MMQLEIERFNNPYYTGPEIHTDFHKQAQQLADFSTDLATVFSPGQTKICGTEDIVVNLPNQEGTSIKPCEKYPYNEWPKTFKGP